MTLPPGFLLSADEIAHGLLTPGKRIAEATSGNTGIVMLSPGNLHQSRSETVATGFV